MNDTIAVWRDRKAGHADTGSCTPGEIVQLPKKQIIPASTLLAEAFYDSPVLVKLFGDTSKRTRLLPIFFNFIVRYGLLTGDVHISSTNLEGVAIWIRSDKDHVNLSTLLQIAFPSLPMLKIGRTLTGLIQYDKYVTRMRKKHLPSLHWYLHMLAVAPEHQGNGHAGRLIKPMLARIKQQQLPCYLETQEPQNVEIYKHCGFKILEQTTIPNLNIPNWAMLRS